ncbi:MAG: hypothetical protein ACHBN1_27065 [Heteroscytonema crispum UTEX LB 1556]
MLIVHSRKSINYQPSTINDPSGEPVAWVGKPYQGRPFTINHQPSTTLRENQY